MHIDTDENGSWAIHEIVEGDSIKEVLQYMQYTPDDLTSNLHLSIDKALRKKLLTPIEAAYLRRKYRNTLESYTYLVT